jgi:KDO2-lipid IV(A) lauroyltransferase
MRGRGTGIGEYAQAAAVRLCLGFFGLLPLDAASSFGGAVARLIGPTLPVSARARRNLQRALPYLGGAERERIIRRMWDNLGRVVAEYPHLSRIRCFGGGRRVGVRGTEHIDRARDAGRGIILVSGHFGNWEIGCVAAAQYGLDVAQVYRAANNPAVEAIMLRLRRSLGVDPISKGAAGARRIIAAIKAKRTLAMLVDQKMNDGIAVPFLGRDAMTASAAAELALRYDCALLPARVDRVGGSKFRVTVYPPLPLPRTGDRQADILALMTAVNQCLETWVRDDPAQWFWLHRRWPDGS